MIEEGHGNLLTADVDALVNTVNTVGVMGKGIALQFKRAFPANYEAYRAACERGQVRLGTVFPFDTGRAGPRRYVLNFPTKAHWRDPSRLPDIAAGLDSLVEVVRELGITSVAIPALGCGLGGLAWPDVLPLIEAACARMPDVRAAVYPPEGAPPPESMPNATRRPRLNIPMALLIVAIARYLGRARLHEVRDGVSDLEVQKLAYLLQVLGAPLRLAFKRGRYGPYADGLTRVLGALEGHYLTGLGDRSARVTEFAPIRDMPGSVEAAEDALRGDAADLDRLERLLGLVDGFETPYSLELLATVHFAADQQPRSGEPAVLAERVVAWSMRKARLFTDRHIRIAAQRLGEYHLLPA